MSAVFLMLVAVDFFLPLRAFGSAFHVAMNGVSAGKKIISLLEMEEPRWGSESVTGNEVVLDHVSFSYDGKREVLKDVNMTFPEKGMTAIVGESGCGSCHGQTIIAIWLWSAVIPIFLMILCETTSVWHLHGLRTSRWKLP